MDPVGRQKAVTLTLQGDSTRYTLDIQKEPSMSDRVVEPHISIIFGGTGDLAKRKLMPALARLSANGHLKGRHVILGLARSAEQDDEGYRAVMREAIAEGGVGPEEAKSWCNDCVHYHSIGHRKPDDFRALRERIEALEKQHGLPGNRMLYLSLPPEAFPETIKGLGEAGLNRSPGWTRIVIEKPFGTDLASAHELNEVVHRYYDESQIYRIDHYLGKETVQNLFFFRFANVIFESLWNRDRVAAVDIAVAEDLGVEGRGGYYERSGALRDMIQNHVMQLLALIAMEPPITFDAEAIRHEKIKLLNAVTPIRPEHVVFGQYAAGRLNGKEVIGYRDEPGVADDSTTETFAAIRFAVNTWRWQGVPFTVRSGKRLKRRLTQISVTFQSAPVSLFESVGCDSHHPNALVLRLQPDEGFFLGIQLKVPGEPFEMRMVPLTFSYERTFGKMPEAYETLLLDVLQGDQTLFVHADEVEASWRLLTPLLEQAREIHSYSSGSWGPEAARKMVVESQEFGSDPFECAGLP